MTNILALETSTDICSVSIRKGVDVFNFHESLPRQHTENLLSVISALLKESKLGFKDLDAIAVGVGPGSYTGVRLSCAVAQGIAFSHDIKGLILSSLELIAIEAFNKISLINPKLNELLLRNLSLILFERLKQSNSKIVALSAN